jgi:hypothetical protein
MTEQIPTTSPTRPEDRETLAQTRRSDPTTPQGTQRRLRTMSRLASGRRGTLCGRSAKLFLSRPGRAGQFRQSDGGGRP